MANLIVNGGFTIASPGTTTPNADSAVLLPGGSTAIDGWTVIGGPAGDDQLYWAATGFDGLTFPDADAVALTGDTNINPQFGMEQTIATTPGMTFALTFEVGTSSEFPDPSGAGVSVTAGNLTTTITGIVTTGTSVWTPEEVDFTATSTSTTIIIQGDAPLPNPHGEYIGLDNVAVNPTTNPAPPANLVTNGSFEQASPITALPILPGTQEGPSEGSYLTSGSTTILGWTVTGNGVLNWLPDDNQIAESTPFGVYFLNLAANNGLVNNNLAGAPYDGVTQTIATTPGTTYQLTFDIGNDNTSANTGVLPTGNGLAEATGSAAMPGWTVIGGPADGSDGLGWVSNANSYGTTAETGSDFLDLTGYRDSAPYFGVTQTVATTVGASYALTFWLGVDNGNAYYTGPIGVSVTAGATTQTIENVSPTGSGNQWVEETVDFTATSTASAISIQGVQGDHYIGLDNVAVEQTGPESTGTNLIVNGDFDEPSIDPVGVSVTAGAATATFDNVDPTTLGNSWTPETLDFTATSTTSTIAFQGDQGQNYIGLDNVTVTALGSFGPDVFTDTQAATSGPYTGQYLWIDPNNWSSGVPADGAAASVASSGIDYDNLTALSLASLALAANSQTDVLGGSLTVASLTAGSGGELLANAADAGAPVTVTVGAIGSSGGSFGAVGTDARFVDNGASDPGGNDYLVFSGGLFELAATPSASSELSFNTGPGTIALADPAASNAVLLTGVAAGDTLELPGSSVTSVGFGTNSLSVTTSAGTYAFSNVTYAGTPIVGFTAALDATTGLEAITFASPDMFSEQAKATSGPLSGFYLWNNPANWSAGVPVNGDIVGTANNSVGYDNLAALSLSQLTLGTNSSAEVDVVGDSLTVATVVGTGAGGLLLADAESAGAPVTVTVGTIASDSGSYLAMGAGATFVDNSATDQPGSLYEVSDGGLLELAATPLSNSALWFLSGGGTIALKDPAASNAAAILGLAAGDTLEVPGSSVSDVTGIGTDTLSITTDAGTYVFNDVTNASTAPTGFTSGFDSATGLASVTFTGPDMFSEQAKATSGPLSGLYLWNNPANWSAGVPVNGDIVGTANNSVGYDNLAALSLSQLTLGTNSSAEVDVVGGSLTVATVVGTGAGGLLLADAESAGAPVTVTVGTIASDSGSYLAMGAGATFVDNSATDQPGSLYEVSDGGLLELAATPLSNSALWFLSGGGTIALKDPAASNAAAILGLAAGDTLEVPGSSVSDVTGIGTSSLTVTTDAGTYVFNDVTNASTAPTGFTSGFDSATGLASVTFTGPDMFSEQAKATSGPLSGLYLWNNPANWSAGVPVNGDIVGTANNSVGYDNLAALSLSQLTLGTNSSAEVDVVGGSLTVATVVGTGAGGLLLADAESAGAPVTVTVGTIASDSGSYLAMGAGATFVDNSATDQPGSLYEVSDGGLLELAATPLSNSALWFLSGGGTIALKDPAASNAAAILGLAAGDTLEVPGSSVSDVTGIGTDTLSITTDAGTYVFNNVTNASAAPTRYTATHDATTGLEAVTMACFAAGTHIATDHGMVTVETLRERDRVRTLLDGALRPIVWLGHRRVDCRRHPDPRQVWPIRIAANAFAPGQPRRDLWVSPDHALFVDGVLMPARYLVNRETVSQQPRDVITYWHIELSEHTVLSAEDLPAESYLDTGNRAAFANGGSVIGPQAEFTHHVREARCCAPLVVTGPKLAAAKRRLNERSKALRLRTTNAPGLGRSVIETSIGAW